MNKKIINAISIIIGCGGLAFLAIDMFILGFISFLVSYFFYMMTTYKTDNNINKTKEKKNE